MQVNLELEHLDPVTWNRRVGRAMGARKILEDEANNPDSAHSLRELRFQLLREEMAMYHDLLVAIAKNVVHLGTWAEDEAVFTDAAWNMYDTGHLLLDRCRDWSPLPLDEPGFEKLRGAGEVQP